MSKQRVVVRRPQIDPTTRQPIPIQLHSSNLLTLRIENDAEIRGVFTTHMRLISNPDFAVIHESATMWWAGLLPSRPLRV